MIDQLVVNCLWRKNSGWALDDAKNIFLGLDVYTTSTRNRLSYDNNNIINKASIQIIFKFNYHVRVQAALDREHG